MSAARPASELLAPVIAGDLFEAFGERTRAVIQHSGKAYSAIGRSRSIVVPAGADHVGRAASLTQGVLSETNGLGIAMGALPFDGSCEAVLRMSDRAMRGEPAHVDPPAEPNWAVTGLIPDPLPVEYETAVAAALRAIDAGEVEKVVLARALVVEADSPIDPRLVARRLSAAESGSYVFLVSLPGGSSSLVGASPELVVRRRGMRVSSDPLAGTAQRSADRTRDAEIARQLLDTVKERREHRLTAEAVADALAPFCSKLVVDPEPSLTSTATLWHLQTSVRGTLKPDAPDALTIAAALHPTPAVCGTPRAAAAELITRLEGFDRRFYAGLVGWVDGRGDGEWALTLRCAEITGSTARLHAGAGIVAGSDPAAEDLETEAKFGVLLRALGVEPGEG
jgi:isochorismate synthase